MWELARRDLLRERTRLVATIGGVAFSVILMLVLLGLYNGYQRRISDYFGRIPADLWVVQSGTSNFFHSSSVLPEDAGTRIARLPGVRSVTPYVGRQVGFEVDGRSFVTYVVGVQPGVSPSGPITIASGTATLAPGTIAINAALAHQAGLAIGDTIELRGRPFRISALTSGGDMVMYQYSLVTLSDAFALQGSRSIVNYFLVSLDPGASAAQVQREISVAVPEGEAWTPARVVAENQGTIKDTFLPVVGMLVAIGIIVGTAVIGLTTYSGVVERRREYGVLKALGADAAATFRVVFAQGAVAGLAGYLLGFVTSIGLARLLPGIVPQFTIQLDAAHAVGVLAAVAGMVVASVALPVLRLSRIDPAEVFSA